MALQMQIAAPSLSLQSAAIAGAAAFSQGGVSGRWARHGWSRGLSTAPRVACYGSRFRRTLRAPPVRASVDVTVPAVGTVTEVNKDTFWPLVSAAGDKFSDEEQCGPCKVIAPKYQGLSEKYLDVVFLKLDCNHENRPLAKELGIRVVPTFKVLKNGQVVKEVTGAKLDDLVMAIETARLS